MPPSKKITPNDQTEAEDILDELEAEDAEPAPSTEKQIEQKYDEGQARIVIQRNDFLVPNLLAMFEKKKSWT